MFYDKDSVIRNEILQKQIPQVGWNRKLSRTPMPTHVHRYKYRYIWEVNWVLDKKYVK